MIKNSKPKREGQSTWILWKYLLREHAGPFMFALSVITLIFLLNLVFRELGRFLSRGLGFQVIVEFFFLNIAWMIALAIPMAVLVATVMAFGRLSGDNEIVALKSNGISILQLLFPILVVAGVLAVGLVQFNNAVLPEFNHRLKILASDIARTRPTLSLEPGVFFRDLPHYSLMVKEIEEHPDTSFVKSVFIEDSSDPDRVTTIVADSGKVYFDYGNGQLVFMLYDGEFHELDLLDMQNYRILTFPKQRITIDVPDARLQRSRSAHRGDREKSADMLLADIEENKDEIRKQNQRVEYLFSLHVEKYMPLNYTPAGQASDTTLVPEIEKYKIYNPNIHRALADHLKLAQDLQAKTELINTLERENSKLMVEVHKKYSIPVACIIFVLIGAPLGIMTRRGNMAMAAGISFVFFLIFWASLMGGEKLADKQIVSPFIAMWFADLLVGIGGLILVMHSIRESTFIRWDALGQWLRKRLARS